MGNEKILNVALPIDPDLTKEVKTRKPHHDIYANETIPSKTVCFELGVRWDGKRKLIAGYMTKESYEKWITE